jgi:hypothetical protein
MMNTDFANEVRRAFYGAGFWPHWVGEVEPGKVLIEDYKDNGIGKVPQVLSQTEFDWEYLGPSVVTGDNIWSVRRNEEPEEGEEYVYLPNDR